MYIIRYSFIFLLLSVLLVSCLEEEQLETRVISEQIVFVSGETAIFSGRIVSNGALAIEDHGYELSTTEDFSNPIIISLGEKSIPGRFIAETNQLEVSQSYFCRSFAIENGSTLLGNVLNFSTLKQVLVNFEPRIGRRGQIMRIEGSNLTDDSQVLFNGNIIPNIDLSLIHI